MYIAMNRFRVNAGFEDGFENRWRERDRHLSVVGGFVTFRLLRGATEDGVTTYLSHTTWQSEDAFREWTQSAAFKKAHADARMPEGTVAGPPKFEGYAIIFEER